MPIYEYGCQGCGHTFERLQKVSDEPIDICPECAVEGSVKKLISRSSFVLKGGGWYKDHYGLKSNGGGSAADSGGSDADSGGSDADSGGSDAGSGGSGD